MYISCFLYNDFFVFVIENIDIAQYLGEGTSLSLQVIDSNIHSLFTMQYYK